LDVANVVADQLDSAGFAVQLDRYGDGNANVIARWGSVEAPAICLSGHLDTVSVTPADWSVDPFGAEIRDGHLYGRGAVDMKTGVAALVDAAVNHVETSQFRDRGMLLILTAEEEVGSLGADHLMTEYASNLPEVDLLLIAEPTSNQLLTGHRGATWIDLVSRGRSCHASTPELGDNAIERLMRALQRVMDWAEQNPSQHEVLGSRTLNIGKIRGGMLRNIVPDEAVAELDFRVPQAEESERLVNVIAEVIGGDASVSRVLDLPPVYTDAADPSLSELDAIVTTHVQSSSSQRVARFFTDASVLTPAMGNPPTAICGPGSADLAHVVDEWCHIDEIAVASRIYRDVLARWLSD
jgi:succinyl-diaminopimelate desuccinylase